MVCSQPMKTNFTLFILLIMIFSTSVFAKDLSGIISIKDSVYYLVESNSNQKYLIKFFTQDSQEQISKLDKNDYVSFEGQINADTQEVSINSINFVGLHKLIGTWTADDQYCYIFKNFNELLVYEHKLGTRCSSYQSQSDIKYLTYTVNPSSSNWFALFSDDLTSYGGDLIIKSKKRIELTIYDSNTGGLVKLVKLVKIR